MTRDERTPTDDRNDDTAIAALVREAAERWSMPPVRLDAPGWRERVRSPRTRRAASLSGWFQRAGRAASAAVALTVAAALIAVVITRPPAQPGKSGEPSSGATSRPSGPISVTPSTLPKLLVNGEAPQRASVVVQLERGGFSIVDLGQGNLGRLLEYSAHGSAIHEYADGSIVCLCLTESQDVDAMPTADAVDVVRYDPGVEFKFQLNVDSFVGAPDPRDAGKFIPERAPHVLTQMSFSADGRYGFVGWSLRDSSVWRSGIVVVDVSDGSVVSRLALPDAGTGDGDARHVVDAPQVIGSTLFERLLIARPWYGWHPVASTNATYDFGAEVFAASFKGGDLSGAATVAGTDGCGDFVLRGGPTHDGGTWLACAPGRSAETVLRRIGPNGTALGDVRIPGAMGIEGDLLTTSRDGGIVYIWNPATATMTSFEVATGTTVTGTGPTAARASGPLTALGNWLAPVVAAKSFLQGAVVLSPDGTRLYAIGVQGDTSGPEPTGSSGVFVFDAASLALIDHWQPTADFVSMAVSGDGRFVYAAGMPGVDAGGDPLPRQGASITVFDTTDGSVRVLAGELGSEMITFASTTLE